MRSQTSGSIHTCPCPEFRLRHGGKLHLAHECHLDQTLQRCPPRGRHRKRERISCSAANEADRLLKQVEHSDKIGSEYGEGYIQYRISGEPRRLDVDTLNEELRIMGVARMRLQINPDSGFGMIFDLEGVIADTKQMKEIAWQKVAKEEGLRIPSSEQLDSISDMRLERVITEVLQWSQEWSRAKELAWRVASAYSEEFAAATEPQPGVREWLHVLSKVNVPCAVVSTFDRITVRRILERMGLSEFFTAAVTAEDGMETWSQRFLCSAIKLARPPNQCVVFTSSLAGLTAAHNCTSKAVAVRRRQFRQADLSVVSLSELAVYNIRRLFANQGSDFMSLQREPAPKSPRVHRIRNATM